MLGLLGKKIGMTTVFGKDGAAVPVTVLEVGPCVITEIKENGRDGYTALQIGYGDVTDKHVHKPQRETFKKRNVTPKRFLREFRLDDVSAYAIGQELKADLFSVGDYVDVSAISKGKGYQGVMKRHGMAGGPKSHGSNFHRRPGSIGQCAWPSRVFKNMKMSGQMGNTQVTIQNLAVVDVKVDDNLILVKGAVPGARNSLIKLTYSAKKKRKEA